MPGSFFDSNVVLYIASGEANKADRAEQLLRGGGTISVQVLNETANVARRKMELNWLQLRSFLSRIRGLATVMPLTVETHEMGLALAERHGFSTYDAMIVASALQADCDVLWSEDLHHGLMIDNRLQVLNPFRAA
ncbi:MAG TPA: PIN domain-containing protein [Stellaceae bacterium]|jgi:predicted nucleic acid-binding protein|nr:PIN domain-containing protein [Stellaceae bacterium]